MQKQLKKQDIIKEFLRCGKDPIHFIKTYGKIVHPKKGLIPFALHPFQEDIINGYISNRKNIILKARQIGVSTITGAFCAWLMIFKRHQNVLVIANKQDVSTVMVKIAKTIIKNLPPWFNELVKITTDNKQSLELSNGSRIKALANTRDSGRSEAVSFFVVDEAAAIDKMDELWSAVSPTTSQGGRIAILSTPRGNSNFFYHMFTQAQNGENDFNCRFGKYTNPYDQNETYSDRFMWWVYPTYNKEWFEQETKGKNPRQIANEYCCNFLASGDTFIYPSDLAKLEKNIRDPIRKDGVDRNVWVFKDPVPGAMYIISADVSRGDSDDYSGFHVFRIDNMFEQVAEYRGKIPPDLLGEQLVEIGKMYNNAIIAPENNSGWAGQSILRIQQLNYPFMYYSSRKKDGAASIDMYYAMTREDLLPGYAVTVGNRVHMLAKMEEYIRQGYVQVYSSRLVSELRTFAFVNEKPQAVKGQHDDLVMALAGGIWVRDESFSHAYRGADVAKSLISAMSLSSKKSIASSYNLSNNSYVKIRIEEYAKETNEIKLSNGHVEKLDWLIRTG